MGVRNLRIYTDGACSGNPGPGGYAAIITEGGKTINTIKGGFKETTSPRMELMAVAEALEALNWEEKFDILVLTDSAYVCNAFIRNWISKWESNLWMTSSNTPVQNQDLWRRVITACGNLGHVTFKHVSGHSGVELNEACDRIAVSESKREDLPVDEGFDASKIERNVKKTHTKKAGDDLIVISREELKDILKKSVKETIAELTSPAASESPISFLDDMKAEEVRIF